MKLKKEELKFSKQQIVSSKRYEKDIDIVRALLVDSKEYTLKEVDSIITRFKEGVKR